MTSSPILYQTDDRIARITLNRPEKLNAINDEMPPLLSDAVMRANEDDAVHVIVLSGAGRAFCSGYDLELYAEVTAFLNREARLLDAQQWHDWLELYWEDAIFWAPATRMEGGYTNDPELELNFIFK